MFLKLRSLYTFNISQIAIAAFDSGILIAALTFSLYHAMIYRQICVDGICVCIAYALHHPNAASQCLHTMLQRDAKQCCDVRQRTHVRLLSCII